MGGTGGSTGGTGGSTGGTGGSTGGTGGSTGGTGGSTGGTGGSTGGTGGTGGNTGGTGGSTGGTGGTGGSTGGTGGNTGGTGGGTSRPDATFPGGSLSDLEALGPGLVFGTLTMTGKLTLEPGDPSNIVLDVDNLNITSSGSIGFDQTACSYQKPPTVRINASAKVEIHGPVDLHGKFGKATTSSSTCNRCDGVDGGSFYVNAQDIVSTARIDTSGGWGSRDTLVVGADLYTYGCDGGNGGVTDLSAGDTLTVQGGTFDTDGGDGGYGNQRSGNDGTHGALGVFGNNSGAVDEVESNGSAGLAQLAGTGRYTLMGSISSTDDSSVSNPVTITFTGGTPPPDPVEDVYRLRLDGNYSVNLSLSATNSTTDLDMYLLDGAATNILAESNGPGASESISELIGPGDFLVGVSWCCNTPASNYSLSVSMITY